MLAPNDMMPQTTWLLQCPLHPHHNTPLSYRQDSRSNVLHRTLSVVAPVQQQGTKQGSVPSSLEASFETLVCSFSHCWRDGRNAVVGLDSQPPPLLHPRQPVHTQMHSAHSSHGSSVVTERGLTVLQLIYWILWHQLIKPMSLLRVMDPGLGEFGTL